MNPIESQPFIPQLILEHIQSHGINFIRNIPSDLSTIDAIIQYCEKESSKLGIDYFDFKKIVKSGLSIGYDKRYATSKENTDARNLNIETFTKTFWNIMTELNRFSPKEQNVIVIGFGNGLEGKLLYKEFQNISIVDISNESLKRAQKILPYAKTYEYEANNLNFFQSNTFDSYISLRTFQSTFFDTLQSLKEARRLLKHRGALVLSIACGYRTGNNNIEFGLYNPFSGNLEKERPLSFVNKIINELRALNFHRIKTKKIFSEIFIYAQKY